MKILVIGPSWVGDMVMAQPLFRCLHSLHADLRLDVLALDWTRDLLARMPEVTNTLSMPIGHGRLALGERRRLGKNLRQQHYDQAIVLPNSFKSALIPFFAAIPRRTGWRGEARGCLLNDSRRLDKTKYRLMVERFAALAYPPDAALPDPLPRPVLQTDPAGLEMAMAQLELNRNRAVVVFCPGAEFGAAKKWPEPHYAAVADFLVREGRQVWLMGSANDRKTCESVLAAMQAENRPYCHNLAGSTSLGAAIDLMSVAQLVISNDSGLMHVAAALNRPLIAVYGSTSPAFTPPLADRTAIVSLGLDCSPCFKRECPLGHLDCLRKLTSQAVIDKITLLN